MKEYKIKINGNEYNVAVKDLDENMAQVSVNGTLFDVELEQKTTVVKTKTPKNVAQPTVAVNASPAAAPVAAPKAAPAVAGAGAAVKSPLPGVILDVYVKVGDTVAAGQKVMMLEAMKMENNIESDVAGVVKAINVNKGDSVLQGDVLLQIG